MAHYAVVVTKSERNYSGYVPDLPGCVATGATRPQVLSRLRTAVEMHLEGMREDGLPIPRPRSRTAQLKIGLKKVRGSAGSSAKRAA